MIQLYMLLRVSASLRRRALVAEERRNSEVKALRCWQRARVLLPLRIAVGRHGILPAFGGRAKGLEAELLRKVLRVVPAASVPAATDLQRARGPMKPPLLLLYDPSRGGPVAIVPSVVEEHRAAHSGTTTRAGETRVVRQTGPGARWCRTPGPWLSGAGLAAVAAAAVGSMRAEAELEGQQLGPEPSSFLSSGVNSRLCRVPLLPSSSPLLQSVCSTSPLTMFSLCLEAVEQPRKVRASSLLALRGPARAERDPACALLASLCWRRLSAHVLFPRLSGSARETMMMAA
ncbi:hypothetical protein CRUP_036952, partial [Coryphaenoides rupestris]